MPDNQPQFHYFIVSSFGWRTGNNLGKLINQQARDDGVTFGEKSQAPDYKVYYVPLPESAEYEIDNFMPIVNGRRLMFKHNYKAGVTWPFSDHFKT